MQLISTYLDVLSDGESALALYTDGRHLKIKPSGLSESGFWKIARTEELRKVVVYRKVEGNAKIYVGEFAGLRKIPSREDTKVIVTFTNAKLVGRTDKKWTDFSCQPGGRSQRVYLPRPGAEWRDPSEEKCFIEGHSVQVTLNKYERDMGARAACVKHFGAKCRVCSLDFSEHYGESAAGFIHVHHLTPLAKIGKAYKVDPVADLLPVCPNCHAMLHKLQLSPEQLRLRIKP
jgi:hypothetical protein